MSTALTEISPPARSLGSWVQDELEQLISQGALLPGQRLNEVALARQLGVSRGPVREAARALEKTGLVTAVANRGVFVRSLTIDEAADIYGLVAILFGFAAGQVAAVATATEALELRELVGRMERAIAAGDRDAYFAVNVCFHERIMSLSRNRQVEAVYLSFTKKLLVLRRRSFEVSGNMAESNAEHGLIVDAVLAGSAELARRRGEEHARAGRARFLASIDDPEAELSPATAAVVARSRGSQRLAAPSIGTFKKGKQGGNT